MIPQHFIDDLIARADIVEVVGRRVQLKKAGREFKANCPFHDEKTPSFTVSPAKGFYHCFGCGAHGTALGFLMDHDHMSFVDAVETLAHMLGIEVPRDESERPARRYDELYALTDRAARWFRGQLKHAERAVAYLQQRGIDGATAKRFGVGYAPAGWSNLLDEFGSDADAIERLLAAGLVIRNDEGRHYDRFRERIMFPIRDARGRTIGFGGRVLGDEEPKYLNSPETVLFHKGRELYGLYEARQALRSIERLVVVEGYMDVIGLARHGIDYGVATLGTATTGDHLNRLFRLTEDVWFAFDGDRAGRQAAWRALENALPHMQEGRQIRFVFLPERQDPDSYVQAHGAKAFEKLLDAGVPLADFLLDEIASEIDLGTVEGRSRLASRVAPLLRRLPRGVYRELLLQQLAEQVKMTPAKLEALLPGRGTAERQRPERATATVRRASSRPGGPSLVRRAIALLLHDPEVARAVEVDDIVGTERPGVGLLRDLVATARDEPTLTTAGLLERFRSHDEGRYLGRLAAAWVPDEENFDSVAEFRHCVTRLGHDAARASARERMEVLFEKQRVDSLNEDEKSELKALSQAARPDGSR